MNGTQKCNRCNHVLPLADFKLKPRGDLCKICIICNEYMRNNREKNRCPHGKSKAQCKECGGSAFCIHDKRKAYCKICGGSALCIHNIQKTRCKECGGSAYCIHDKLKEHCKECGGSAFCIHDKRKNRCKECDKYGHLYSVVMNRMREVLKKRDLKADIEYLNVDIEMYYEILSYLNRDTNFTWDNYGELWNIDHIKPLGEKDITDEELIKRLSWCNTRPLSVIENSKKHNKPLIED